MVELNMTSSWFTASLLLVLVVIAGGFQPFAGLAELSPQRLADFCSEDGGHLSGVKSGVRRCVHSLRRRLEDGGEVQLRWQLDVDPTRIFSLDVEHGMRLTRCNANELDLEIPRDIERAQLPVKEGDCVVASRWIHHCPHLHEKNLYHCVLGVEEINSADAAERGVSQIRLLTMEMPSLAHLADAVDFYISYTPPEAEEVVRFPRRQTHKAGPMATTQSDVKLDDPSLKPNTVANLGWNWDFERNATQHPEVKYAVPGGRLTLQQAYAKAHVGIWMNFTSRFSSDDLVPRINFELGMDGHATLNARLISELDAAGFDAADADLYRRTDIPILQQLAETRWLGPLDFSIGSIPMSFEPGFQFTSSAHKLGQFRGSLQLGVNAHAVVRPRLRFSSINGLDAACTAELKDIRLSPPMWMISTQHFEMGMQLEPQLWIRGQLGGVENIKASLALLPFANVTIRRSAAAEEAPSGVKVADDHSTLTRRLWTARDWEAHWAKRHAHCDKDQVHFGLDAGLLVRGQVEHMKLPSAFPQIGWLQRHPDKAMRYSSAEGSHSSLFEEACAGGICDGTFPACAREGTPFFEQITWHFNRPFLWDGSPGSFADSLRSEIAYTFSILPADVDVRLPRSSKSPKSSVRRLSGRTAQAGPEPASSVVTTFKEGLPYVVDRHLVEMLLSHGSLSSFDDGQQKHGALYITGFSLQREQEIMTHRHIFAEAILVALVLLACACFYILLPKKRRRPAASGVFYSLHSGPSLRERDQEMQSETGSELAAAE